MAGNDRLNEVRARIDELDEQIQRLISERAACASKIAELKGGGEKAVYYRPEREAQVLQNVIARNSGELRAEDMARIFREIMSACLAVEQPLAIAFLGPQGTFTQEAARKHFGHAVNMVPQVTINDVFRDVEAGRSHYGVVAVENSTEGSVTHTLDMFLNSSLKICGEVELRIHHHLLSRAEALKDIVVVYGHQQALAQCRGWLDTHLAGIEQVAMNSNADAAKKAADKTGAAAIAGKAAAELYGHTVLAANIEDEPNNTTRFLVIGHHYPPPSGTDKTSLLLTTSNQPGALYRLLAPFVHHGVSLTRIESRPSRRGRWDYVFFIDMEGHADDTKVAVALQELEEEAAMVKVLGAYPRGVI